MLMRRLCYWLQGKLPTRHIPHEGVPYLERSYVGTAFGLRFYLHRFVACDEDGVHDHPFRWSLSTILAGWYHEDRWSGRVDKHMFNLIGPNDFHRVVLPENDGRDVWTLFIHTGRVKPWGFLRPTAKGQHGSVMTYAPESEPTDPTFSEWHLTAPTGARLREDPSLNKGIPAFNIPLGQNAYSAGYAKYPDSARQHALLQEPTAVAAGTSAIM
jgi:hypothetical protein